MSFGVDPWSDRIASSSEDGPRRALLAEVSLWRASRLTDIVAARQATYAMSRLHWLLRDAPAAEREARQLLSLCQTPPRASADELKVAKGWLESLGAKVPKVHEPKKREERDRGRREKKPQAPRAVAADTTGLTRAVDAGDSGDWAGAMKLAKGKKGARADLVWTWLQLGRALADEDADRGRRDLHRLAARLRAQLGGPDEADDAGEPKARERVTKADKPTREPKVARADKPAKADDADKGPSPRELARERTDALKVALEGNGADVDALIPLLKDWPRLWRAIAAAERWDLDDARFERLLVAVDRASDEDRPIPGGTSAAIRRAAGGSAAFRELLLNGSTARRYGGTGTDVVIDLAAAASTDGWEVDRVLRGPTRKEAQRHPVLDTLGSAMDGLWRVLVKKGESHAEIWYAAELPAEGRAGVPMLLLEEHPRVIVLPVDPELLGWYGSIDGPDAIGWTGDEGDALREALGALG